MLVLLMIEDMLADLGCESVIAAASINRALASIDAQFFDLAMLDMNLNGDNTYSVADALARFSHITE
jgi:CheY-like chemotaxis protein